MFKERSSGGRSAAPVVRRCHGRYALAATLVGAGVLLVGASAGVGWALIVLGAAIAGLSPRGKANEQGEVAPDLGDGSSGRRSPGVNHGKERGGRTARAAGSRLRRRGRSRRLARREGMPRAQVTSIRGNGRST
jgi:hypothetical protein